MCPNISNPNNKKCPPSPFNSNITECRFVKTYIDNRNWLYKVMPGIGMNSFKARYKKPNINAWKCMHNLLWRESFDEAQSDLNAMAKMKKWSEFNDHDEERKNNDAK